MKLGIVGLPNVGKSTLFNAITNAGAESANYPFCTIDPNVGMVTVPDPRLQVLSDMSGSEKIIPTLIEFVDIAGLVKGASEGAGLGNQFLANIREVDAIVQVVRCFDNDDIIHELGSVDPLRDIDIINSELILADIATMEKRLSSRERKARSGDVNGCSRIWSHKHSRYRYHQHRPACEQPPKAPAYIQPACKQRRYGYGSRLKHYHLAGSAGIAQRKCSKA